MPSGFRSIEGGSGETRNLMMDPIKAKYLDRSLGTMSVALWFGRAALVVAPLVIPVYVMTLGLVVILYVSVLAVAGVLLLTAECFFWFGLLLSLPATECNVDRWLLGLNVVAVPVLIAGWVLGKTSGVIGAPHAEIVFVVGDASVFLSGAMCWVIFLRRKAVRLKDPWAFQQMSRLTNRLGAIIALCGLGVGTSWLKARMSVRNPHTLDPLILLPILAWLVSFVLTWSTTGLAIRVFKAMRSNIKSTAEEILLGD